MSSEQLTIVYRLDTFGVDLALRGIRSVLEECGVPMTGFTLYGETVALAEALLMLRNAERKTFVIAGQGFEFSLSCIRNFRLDFLQIKAVNKEDIPWDRWASRYIANPNFVMAWIADSEYEFWQNAEDPLEYTATGKPFDHLPMKSNELPPPLDQTIIDISSNPGRRLLRNGYVEVVGAVMWFGEAFWQITKTDKTTVANTAWLRVSNPLPNVVRVRAAAIPFKTDEGPLGEIQRNLRRLLFPKLAVV